MCVCVYRGVSVFVCVSMDGLYVCVCRAQQWVNECKEVCAHWQQNMEQVDSANNTPFIFNFQNKVEREEERETLV